MDERERLARWLAEEDERERLRRAEEDRKRQLATERQATVAARERAALAAAAARSPVGKGGPAPALPFTPIEPSAPAPAAPATPRGPAPFERTIARAFAPDNTRTAPFTIAEEAGNRRATTGKYGGFDEKEEAARQAMAQVPQARARGDIVLAGQLERQAEALREEARLTEALEESFAPRAFSAATLGLGFMEERQDLARRRAEVDPDFLYEQGIGTADGQRLNIDRPMRAKDLAAEALGLALGMMMTRSLAGGVAGALDDLLIPTLSGRARSAAQAVSGALTKGATSPVTDRTGSLLQRTITRGKRGALEGGATGAATSATMAYAESQGDPLAAAQAFALDFALNAPVGAALEAGGGALFDPVRRRLTVRNAAALRTRVGELWKQGFVTEAERARLLQDIEVGATAQRLDVAEQTVGDVARRADPQRGSGPLYRGQTSAVDPQGVLDQRAELGRQLDELLNQRQGEAAERVPPDERLARAAAQAAPEPDVLAEVAAARAARPRPLIEEPVVLGRPEENPRERPPVRPDGPALQPNAADEASSVLSAAAARGASDRANAAAQSPIITDLRSAMTPAGAALLPDDGEDDDTRGVTDALRGAALAAGAVGAAYALRRENDLGGRASRWLARELQLRGNGDRGNPEARTVARPFLGDATAEPPVAVVRADVDREAPRVAQWYAESPDSRTDPQTIAAYRQLAEETRAQAQAMEAAGIRIEVVEADPYKNSAEMMRDVAVNRRIKVFKSNDGDHPLLSGEENTLFRAVHDYFGHAKEGHQFGAVGEERAFREHARMFSPEARRAMATETRGQNSVVNYGPDAAWNRANPAQTRFAEQKAMLMPDALLGEYASAAPRATGAMTTGVEFRADAAADPARGYPRTRGLSNAAQDRRGPVANRAVGWAVTKAVAAPLARALGLPATILDRGLGSWFAGGRPDVTPNLAVRGGPSVNPQQVQQFVLDLSAALRQRGTFLAIPDPQGDRLMVELDVGRRMTDGAYSRFVEQLSAREAQRSGGTPRFEGTTMVRVSPRRVAIGLRPGATAADAEAVARLAREVAPEWRVRSETWPARIDETDPMDPAVVANREADPLRARANRRAQAAVAALDAGLAVADAPLQAAELGGRALRSPAGRAVAQGVGAAALAGAAGGEDDDAAALGAVAGTLASGDAAPLFRSRLREALTSKRYAKAGNLTASAWLERFKQDSQNVSMNEVLASIGPMLELRAELEAKAEVPLKKFSAQELVEFYDQSPLRENALQPIALRERVEATALIEHILPTRSGDPGQVDDTGMALRFRRMLRDRLFANQPNPDEAAIAFDDLVNGVTATVGQAVMTDHDSVREINQRVRRAVLNLEQERDLPSFVGTLREEALRLEALADFVNGGIRDQMAMVYDPVQRDAFIGGGTRDAYQRTLFGPDVQMRFRGESYNHVAMDGEVDRVVLSLQGARDALRGLADDLDGDEAGAERLLFGGGRDVAAEREELDDAAWRAERELMRLGFAWSRDDVRRTTFGDLYERMHRGAYEQAYLDERSALEGRVTIEGPDDPDAPDAVWRVLDDGEEVDVASSESVAERVRQWRVESNVRSALEDFEPPNTDRARELYNELDGINTALDALEDTAEPDLLYTEGPVNDAVSALRAAYHRFADMHEGWTVRQSVRDNIIVEVHGTLLARPDEALARGMVDDAQYELLLGDPTAPPEAAVPQYLVDPRARLAETLEALAARADEAARIGAPLFSNYQRIGGGVNYREVAVNWPGWPRYMALDDHWASKVRSMDAVVAHARLEEHVLWGPKAWDALRASNERVARLDAQLRQLSGRVGDLTAQLEGADQNNLNDGQRAALDELRSVYERQKEVGQSIADLEREFVLRPENKELLEPEVLTVMAESQSDPAGRAASKRKQPDDTYKPIGFTERYAAEGVEPGSPMRALSQAQQGTAANVDPVPWMPWDTPDRWVALNVAVALREVAMLGTDGLAIPTPGNRVAYAALGVKKAELLYGQALPKAVNAALRAATGENIRPEEVLLRGQAHLRWKLTPEQRERLARYSFPMLTALLMTAVPGVSEAQDGEVNGAATDSELMLAANGTGMSTADKFFLGASALAVGVLAASAKRHGVKAALTSLFSRNADGRANVLSPAETAALGLVAAQVDDQDYDDYGKAAAGLAMLSAIGSRRFAAAGDGFARKFAKALSTVPGGRTAVLQVSPDLLLNPEVKQALEVAYRTVSKGRAQAREVQARTAALSPAEQRAVTDAIRGESWEDTATFTPEQTATVLALAMDIANRTAVLGKHKVSLGVISEAQFLSAGGDQYLPRMYAYYEALAQVAEKQGGQVTSADAWRIAEDKSRTLDLPVRAAEARLLEAKQAGDAAAVAAAQTELQLAEVQRDRTRRRLGEVREAGYVAGYAIERGYQQVAAAQLLRTLRDTPGVIPDEYLGALDEYLAARALYDSAVDLDARVDARSRAELARLRLDAANRGIASITETQYRTGRGTREGLRQQFTAERMDAREELRDANAADRDAVQRDERAAAKQLMEDAQRRMADIAQRYRSASADYENLPESFGYGALAGMPVKKEVALTLRGAFGREADPSVWGKVWSKFMRAWKGSKTILNPATHAGNVMSNVTMLHMSGLSIAEQPVWMAKAIRDMQGYGEATRALAENGVFSGLDAILGNPETRRSARGSTREALLALRETSTPEVRQAIEDAGLRSVPEQLADAGYTRTGRALEVADAGAEPLRWGYDKAKALYENEDNVFRVAAYLHGIAPREQGGMGLTPEQALQRAQRDLVDFRSNSPLLQLAANSVFPFIRYPVKAVPAFARMVVDHPERWLTLTGALLALNEMGELASGVELNEDDVPADRRGTGLGAVTPDLVQVPWGAGDAYGTPAVDFTRWTPLSGITTGAPPGTFAGEAGVPNLANPTGPAMDLAAAVRFNIMPGAFRPDEKFVRYEDQGDALRVMARVGAGARNIMAPPLLAYHLDEFRAARESGDPVRKANWLRAQVGLRPRYYTPGEVMDREQYDLDRALGDIRQEERRKLRRLAPDADAAPIFERYESRTERARRVFEQRTGQPAAGAPGLVPRR